MYLSIPLQQVEFALERLKSPGTQPFVQPLVLYQNKGNINAPHYWPSLIAPKHGAAMQKAFPYHDVMQFARHGASTIGIFLQSPHGSRDATSVFLVRNHAKHTRWFRSPAGTFFTLPLFFFFFSFFFSKMANCRILLRKHNGHIFIF